MKLRGLALPGAVGVMLLLALGAKERKLVERWTDPQFERHRFEKLLIIAVTDDAEARKNFENLFVSHLRGKGIEGVTSHSMVEDLTAVDASARQELLHLIDEKKIDGAISVRAVPLKDIDEREWAARWSEEVRAGGTLRQLIEQTLPVARGKGRRYGIEAALWDANGWHRVWGGRTDPYTVEGMRKGAPEFVQFVMYALDLDGLVR